MTPVDRDCEKPNYHNHAIKASGVLWSFRCQVTPAKLLYVSVLPVINGPGKVGQAWKDQLNTRNPLPRRSMLFIKENFGPNYDVQFPNKFQFILVTTPLVDGTGYDSLPEPLRNFEAQATNLRPLRSVPGQSHPGTMKA